MIDGRHWSQNGSKSLRDWRGVRLSSDCRRPARVEASMAMALASRSNWRRRGKQVGWVSWGWYCWGIMLILARKIRGHTFISEWMVETWWASEWKFWNKIIFIPKLGACVYTKIWTEGCRNSKLLKLSYQGIGWIWSDNSWFRYESETTVCGWRQQIAFWKALEKTCQTVQEGKD
jgi:hypothetical protein